MDFMSGLSYFVNQSISESKYKGLKEFDFEEPLTRLIWIASILCISTSFGMSYLLIGDMAIDSRPVVEARLHHQLRHSGGGAHPRIHQGLHQFAFQACA